ncbi:hypothetical protein QBC36DRAFT_81232 [Triangularia setosa]|uniref:Uncharacterized protein n=1 Tax=Triangularia setosa TaxID=2587417 RepID=A0AAN6VZH6_9PEZI|nr:hypothetical protein QBC36DRAFT_81232 [Podospora setosa]
MEFFSAADAAAGLLGTLKATVDAARLFYERTRSVGEAVYDSYLAFDKCHTALEMWTRFWGLDGRLSRRYQEALWGSDGSRTIGRQLAKIKNQMEDVWDELSPLLTRAGITPQTTSQVDWSLAYESRQGVAKIRSLLRKRDLWWFGSGKGDNLLSLINLVWASISDLRELSISCFSMVNGTSLLDHPPETLASAVGLKSFVEAVLDAKAAATMYFNALFDTVRVGILRTKPGSPYPKVAQLDMDLVKKKFLKPSNFQSFDNIQLLYKVSLLPDHQTKHWQPLLIFVDGPHKLMRPTLAPAEQSQEVKGALGIVDAFHAARDSNTCLFTVRSPDDTMSACFRVLPLQSYQLLDLCPSGPLDSTAKLWDLLSTLPSTRVGSYKDESTILSLSGRIALARSLVLMALFLGGTPWLSGARHGIGKIVRRNFLDGGDVERFLLDVEVGAEIPKVDFLQEWRQHLHSVGLALLELGMGMQVREVIETGKGPGHLELVFHKKQAHSDVSNSWVNSLVELLRYFVLGPLFSRFSLISSGSQLKLSFESVNSKLTTTMGEQYAATVKKLLKAEGWKNLDSINNDMKTMTKSCWEVYLCIEEILKAVELARVAVSSMEEAKTLGDIAHREYEAWPGVGRRRAVL